MQEITEGDFLKGRSKSDGPHSQYQLDHRVARVHTELAAYSASKAGMDGLTRSVAHEVEKRGMACNSIAPGCFLTDMSRGLSSAQRAQIINRASLNRLGEPADILEAVKFLLSEGASILTGQTLIMDGGTTC